VTNFLSRLTRFFVVLLGLLVAAVVVFPSFQPGDLIAGLGITSIAIGFALKDILQNFFAGILLLWIKPFRVGDHVRIRDFEGIVDEITIRSTQLKTYDGERVVLPNGDVYVSAILVRAAFGKRRVHLTIGVKASEPLDKVRSAIGEVLGQTAGIHCDPAPEIRAESLLGGVVNLGVYFWTEPDQEQSLRASDHVLSGIQSLFRENAIALA
jgi:small-conductance mechanosensitive channel